MIFYGYFGPHNYVYKKSGAHIVLLQNSAGALQRLPNSVGRTSKAPQFCGAKIDCYFAPQSFRAYEVRPTDIVTGAKIPTKVI